MRSSKIRLVSICLGLILLLGSAYAIRSAFIQVSYVYENAKLTVSEPYMTIGIVRPGDFIQRNSTLTNDSKCNANITYSVSEAGYTSGIVFIDGERWEKGDYRILSANQTVLMLLEIQISEAEVGDHEGTLTYQFYGKCLKTT